MIGFNSQNLFKMANERSFRFTMFKDNNFASNAYENQNMCIDMLKKDEGDEELREPQVLTEQQHIVEFKRLKQLNKSEKECADMSEVMKLREAKYYERQAIIKQVLRKKMHYNLKLAFRKFQKNVDLTEPLNMKHFLGIHDGIHRKQASALGEALLKKVKDAARKDK